MSASSAESFSRITAIDAFERELFPARKRLLDHSLYARINTLDEMRFFMENHVFAVWDFMSLLKCLQRQLTSTSVPWMPPRNRIAARFINEIVLGEESDEVTPGEFISHFELYLEAMHEAGARAHAIEEFLRLQTAKGNYRESLRSAGVPAYVREFVATTMSFCERTPHEAAAAFLFGREDIIPDMFRRILASSSFSESARFAKLKLYLERHIAVDGDSHGPMARKLMQVLCGDDAGKWQEALLTARLALQARTALWDGILVALPAKMIQALNG